MQTKIDVINDAFSQLRISGLTAAPSPEDVSLALVRLESMMAELPDVGYRFEAVPDANSETGVNRNYWIMMASNLAVRLVADYNKQPPQVLLLQAEQSLSGAIARLAAESMRQVQYPNRQPIGSGNDISTAFFRRFYADSEVAPDNAIRLAAGDVDDFTEDYAAYLKDAEIISSYVITPDDGITIVSDSNTDTVISYRVSVSADSQSGAVAGITIKMTTDTGRVTNRTVSIEII